MNTPEVEKVLVGAVAHLRIPQPTDRVYKDECMFSFDTPETETGIYVCLRNFWGLGRDYVEKYAASSGSNIFLHIHIIKHKKEKPLINADGPLKKVTRLAIGVEGGFDAASNGIEYEKEEIHSIVLFPGLHKIPLPDDSLPEHLKDVIAGVIGAESARHLAELEALAGSWDGEVRITSKHSETLVQLQNGKKVPPIGWKCEAEGCEKVDNLWLNLSDGSILCGRKNFDGSGGNNHALEHYAAAKHPLAVKLGTITPDGKGDVYSYDEDDMVIDTNLVRHLAHFGINVSTLEKTEKSMLELEIELNQKHLGEINALTESGKLLKPMRGPGLTGIVNLGNSCYMNSVMQALFNIPEFQERFTKNAENYFTSSLDPVNDFNVQMSKFCLGLLSGKYAKKVDEDENSDAQLGISPFTFKSLIGKGHVEFSTKKQQDAQEFFLHIINVLEKNSRSERNPADCFKFQVEDKVQCNESKCVRYAHRMEYCLPLPIPLEAAINKEEFQQYELRKAEALANKTTLLADETVRLKIPLDACIEAFIARETLNPFYSTATKQVGTASKFTRLATFPDYLVIQLKKFCMGEDWTPKKLDVSVDMPLELDLSALKAKGMQPDEVEFPAEEDEAMQVEEKVTVDEGVVSQLMEMGFHPNACRRAVFSSGNSGPESAMNWIMQHMEDPDLNEPLVACGAGGKTGGGNFLADEEAVVTIQSMGFTSAQAKKALQNTDNNVERAIDWIFSHPDELKNCSLAENANNVKVTAPPVTITDGLAKYQLMGFVSHMGPSSMVGHYVAHIRKENSWVLFNDSRVAASETLPKDLGYLYFYVRL